MLRLALSALTCFVCAVAVAQTVIDSSADKLDKDLVMRKVTAEFLDPTSAQFRAIEPSIGKPDVTCGEVNGKNRFGGYVGFRPFSFNRSTQAVNVYDALPKDHPVYGLQRIA